MLEYYQTYCLKEGLRIIHLPSSGPVSYCGFAVNVGTRDEQAEEFGMAHFVEHLLFKGTQKRKAWHILNRMENVGGELNAYTTKEDTFIYSSCLSDDAERAIELLCDLVCNSQFPEKELIKEKEVVLDEINSYKDNPSELIFDDFENLVFEGHAIGHHILGEKKSLKKFNQKMCLKFFREHYRPEDMVFFFYGQTAFRKVVRLVEKYWNEGNEKNEKQGGNERAVPSVIEAKQIESDKKLHQAHVMIGARAYDLRDPKRTGLYLLNNILGGHGMNSRLNLNLREKYGLVYNVESGITSYSDSGIISIYFGTDPKSKDKCLELTMREVDRLRNEKLRSTQLTAAKKQLKGQLGISSDNGENLALGMGKSFLHLNKYDNLQLIYSKIDRVTSEELQEIANEIFAGNNLFRLIYI
ncbi:MAG: insulinase family protein [Dysgonamonadaceae bacterium]|jgi:predicted Zn-dependent peptidase|nr:insulinase family protein [Dysgonamonadaceae bacterium]